MRISNAASDAASLAETAVNIGALYLQMVKVDLFCNCNANVIDVFSITMRYAETAVNIYQKLMHHGEEESELCYYRAIQLKGSIIYQYAECGYPTANKSEGIRLLQEAYDWNQKHYENTYCDVFEGVAGVILRHEGLI